MKKGVVDAADAGGKAVKSTVGVIKSAAYSTPVLKYRVAPFLHRYGILYFAFNCAN